MKESIPENGSGTKSSQLRVLTNNDLGPWVLKYHRQFYPSTQSFLLAYIICREYYNHRRGYAFPSIDLLSKVLGLSPRMMKYHIKGLREATDKDGNPLWNIVRGYNVSETGNAANRYYPLFLAEVRQGKPPVDDDMMEPMEEQVEDSTSISDDPMGESIVYAPNVKDELADPKEEFSGKYTMDTLPSYVPSNLAELKKRTFGMVSYGVSGSDAKGFNDEQRETMNLILDYCANTKDLPEPKRKEISSTMVKTWNAYPEMDAESFYRRFIVYVLNQLHEEGVNTDIEQDFEARDKGMRMASAMGLSYP